MDKFTTRWKNIHVQRGTFQIYEGMFKIDPLFLDSTGNFPVESYRNHLEVKPNIFS